VPDRRRDPRYQEGEPSAEDAGALVARLRRAEAYQPGFKARAPGPARPRLVGPAAPASMASRPNAPVIVSICPRGLAP